MEEVTIKPRFLIIYIAIVVASIAALLAVSYLNYTRELQGDFFTVFFFGTLILSFMALLATFLKYIATTYTINEREVISVEGLITRTKRSIPFTKIDNITVKQTLMDLIMRTGSIHVDTPGGPGSEISMHYIDLGKLHSVEEMLKNLQHGKKKEEKSEPAEKPPAETKAEEKPAAEKPAPKPARKPEKNNEKKAENKNEKKPAKKKK